MSHDLPQCGDDIQAEADEWAARARALAPMIAAAGDRIEAERKVPADVMKALHEAGLFRLLMPRSLGGVEASPLAYMQVLEEVSAADGSTGWCLGQGLGCSLAAAFRYLIRKFGMLLDQNSNKSKRVRNCEGRRSI